VLLIILELLVTFPPHAFKQSLVPFLFSSWNLVVTASNCLAITRWLTCCCCSHFITVRTFHLHFFSRRRAFFLTSQNAVLYDEW
jgi:hypothetical protein